VANFFIITGNYRRDEKIARGQLRRTRPRERERELEYWRVRRQRQLSSASL